MFNKLKPFLYLFINILFIQLAFSQVPQDLKRTMKGLKDNNEDIQNNIDPDLDRLSTRPKKVRIDAYKVVNDSISKKSNFFGYDFFTKRDSLNFWESLPAPSNYIIGPGDEVVVSIWGETQLRKTFIISRDGKIYDEKVGILNIMGKSIEDAEKYLTSQYGRIYSSLNGTSPTAYLDISLGQIRSINVNFVGEVKFPGVYPVHPFSTVITGLIQAGGIDTTGSLRNIQIKREGKNINVDIYKYLLKGDLPKNIQLRDQDIIIVPIRKNSIKIDSSVMRPSIYEAKNSETIYDMIDYAGGLKNNASGQISLKRIVPFKKRKIDEEQFYNNTYVSYFDSKKVLAQDGDMILPLSIFQYKNGVEIVGQVKKEGTYNYFDGMTLKDLIELGGGFKDTTFLKSVYNSAQLVRRNPNQRYEKVINVKLNDLLNEASTENIKLNNLDRFVVHSNLNYYERKNIKILGEVNIPGEYPLIKDNEDLKSLLIRAGGLTSKALNNGIKIYRIKKPDKNAIDQEKENSKISRVAWKNENVILMPGDSIVVSEQTQTVEVSGEVYNPGMIEFRKNRSIRYYLNSSGGLTRKADKKGIVVISPNGTIVPYKYGISPKITDGSTIVVYASVDAEEFDITQFATNWTSILTSLLTVVILSQQTGS